MRFFNEQVGYPQPVYLLKKRYGVNPINNPERAALIGILPLEEAPAGYTASHYVRTETGYKAIPHSVSNVDMQILSVLREAGVDTIRTVLGIEDPYTANEEPA